MDVCQSLLERSVTTVGVFGQVRFGLAIGDVAILLGSLERERVRRYENCDEIRFERMNQNKEESRKQEHLRGPTMSHQFSLERGENAASDIDTVN